METGEGQQLQGWLSFFYVPEKVEKLWCIVLYSKIDVKKLQIPELENPAEAVLVEHALSSTTQERRQEKRALRRFERLNQAVDILYRQSIKIFGREVENHIQRLNFHATIKCHRITIKKNVSIHQSTTTQKTFFSGLSTCGSVWACPICAAKIQERRAKEIQKFFEYMYKNGKQIIMLTLTFPHYLSDKLAEITKKHDKALKIFREGGSYQRFVDSIEYAGMIHGTEVTFGVNGWHLHTHDLYAIKNNLSNIEKEKIIEFINQQWEKACIKAGLLDINNRKQVHAFRKRSVNVIFNAKSSDYIAKTQETQKEWGADKEVAKASSKIGKKSGITPFQILDKSKNNIEYQELFLEYVLAMRNKSQLFWSKGLKKLVGIVEKTDKQLIDEQEDTATLVATIPANPHWTFVAKNNAQGEILIIAKNQGFAGLQEWFEKIGLKLETSSICEKSVAESKAKFNFRLHWRTKDIEKPPPPPVTIDNDPLAW